MDKNINYKLPFKRFIFKDKEGRIALLLNIALPYLSVSKSEQPELDFFINILLFFIVITLPTYFYAKWKRKNKFKKGEALYPFGYEINSKIFSNLYDYGKKNKENLEKIIKDYAEKECRGNIEMAIDILNLKLKNDANL